MKKIISGHGSGGRLMRDLIGSVIKKHFGDPLQLDDSAVLDAGSKKIAFTTDTFTITPIFFPGGDIGRLAVNGTVNDLAASGAIPKFLSCSLILEEGFSLDDLEKIIASMKSEADSAGVQIVTGDTKVVPNGKGDLIYINTSGIGIFEREPLRKPVEPGDAVIVSGTIGDHGIAIMAARNSLPFSSALKSDCAHLNRMTAALADKFHESIKFMRDPTRGGVASVLNEIVDKKNFGALIRENDLPVLDEVRQISSLLGIDPLYAANEGKMLIVIDKKAAEAALELLRKTSEGKNAAIIGEIVTGHIGKAVLETSSGGKRIIPLLTDEQLPRIC